MTSPSIERQLRSPVVLFSNSWTMGGTEQHLIQLGRGLVERGYTVAAICSARGEVARLREALALAGVRVHVLRERHETRFGAAGRFVDLVRTIRRYPRCILHIHLTGHIGGELALLAGRLGGARAIVRTEHNPPVPPITRMDLLVVKWRDRLLQRVICVSEQTRREHVEKLHRDAPKCVVVHNGIDLGSFNPEVSPSGVHAEFGLEDNVPLIGTVARLAEERKGLNHFVEMAARIAARHPTARFLIVGDGPLRTALEHQVEGLGIRDRVIFAGARADVPRLLAAMYAFVIPSLYEACQYTLLEAMATGRPVVATPAGVAPAVVEHGRTGLLVPYSDSQALAGAVQSLLDDPVLARRLGQGGHDIVGRAFSFETMVDGIVAVYDQAAA